MPNARFVGPRVKSVCGITKNGYLLIVPLRPADVAVPPVLLNRGWVPAEWREAHAAGRWEVLGGATPNVAQLAVLRDSETASSFVPDNTEQQWFWVPAPSPAPPDG
jgi:cytochrome oxidase assembly protein ShyY1